MAIEQIFWTKTETAKAISSSTRHVDHLEAEGLLTPIRRGRWVRYPVDEVKALKEKLARPTSN